MNEAWKMNYRARHYLEIIKSKLWRGGRGRVTCWNTVPREDTLIRTPAQTRRAPSRTVIYRGSLPEDQILSTHHIFGPSLHYGLILSLSALLARDYASTDYCRIRPGTIHSLVAWKDWRFCCVGRGSQAGTEQTASCWVTGITTGKWALKIPEVPEGDTTLQWWMLRRGFNVIP